LPVKADGTPDTLRRTVYQGEAQLMTNVGPLPISFDIDASSLADAVAKYAESTKAGIERAMRELQEMRRQQSSSIVLPPAGATLAAPGALSGGGKIQIP
jgi:aspartate aminotransferase-like enzyme